ncbi:MAG: hypothetical protein LBB75_01800 [Oscillospiraceae bacterium]|jgi:hypothetical protein|nr:hypothetical protein [Oscillospiraceae bacterium]
MMSVILFTLALYAFPPLFLLFFYFFKKGRWIWLTIPASALTLALCCGRALADFEFLGMVLVAFALQTGIVSAATLIAALIKSRRAKRPVQRIPAIAAAVVCAIALGFGAHTALSYRSAGYRQIFDRRAFTQLTQIQPEEIETIDVYDALAAESGLLGITDFHGDASFFSGLEYDGSMMSKPVKEVELSVDVFLKDGTYIKIDYYEDDIFRVYYKNRDFYVRSAQLAEGIG